MSLQRPLGVPWAPSVVGTTSNFLSFHMLILNFSPNTNSKLSFKLIKACKTTAIMFKLNHKLVKKRFSKLSKQKIFAHPLWWSVTVWGVEEGRTAVKEIGGKVSKYVYRLRPAFYYQHRRTNEDFFNDTCRRCRDNVWSRKGGLTWYLLMETSPLS